MVIRPDNMRVLTFQDDDVTAVSIEVPTVTIDRRFGGRRVEMVEINGSARRHPYDKRNNRIGLLLAQGRAYRRLADRLERQANGLIKHAQDVKRHRWMRGKHLRSDSE